MNPISYRILSILIVVLFMGFHAGCAHRPDPADLAPRIEITHATPGETPSTDPAASPAEPPGLPVSQGRISLSVEEAIVYALRNNRDLRVEKLNPVIAGTFEQIERGVYDPELFAEFAYDEEQALETSRATGEQFPTEGSDTYSVAGVRQRFPTGTQIEGTVEHERSLSNRAPDQQIARVGLSVTQSLLRGFGPAVNLVGVRQAELETLASIYELRGFTEALLAQTETAYWNYVLTEQEIGIFEQSLAVARQQRDEIEQRIAVGLLPEIEAAAARAEVARHEQALINARSLMEARRLRLVRLIDPGADKGLDLGICATSASKIDPVPVTDLVDRLELADRSRPDLGEARLRLKQNQLETIVTRNGLLPRLDFFIALGQTGFADEFSESFRELDGDTYDFGAGVRFSHFLGNRAAEAYDLSARASRRQASEAVANYRQLVRLDVRLAVNEVERTRQQIGASTVTRVLQEQTLQSEQERFEVGSGTALQVAQARRDLLVARIAEVGSVIHYRIALVELYRAEGSLLERRGVRLAPFQPDFLRVRQ